MRQPKPPVDLSAFTTCAALPVPNSGMIVCHYGAGNRNPQSGLVTLCGFSASTLKRGAR